MVMLIPTCPVQDHTKEKVSGNLLLIVPGKGCSGRSFWRFVVGTRAPVVTPGNGFERL